MSGTASFRKALEDAVLERHCANHPMTEKWAAGELSRNCLMGIAVEHWHWIKHASRWNFPLCAEAPRDVIALQLENYMEENDDDRPHISIIQRFALVNGADLDEVRKSPGLPTTRAWADWLVKVGKEQPWWCGIAASRVGTESQSPMLYNKVLPALRDIYKFKEDEIEHFWLHSEVDVEHGERGYQALLRHCTTREMQDMAVHYARASAYMRWFYFDGIYLHYEQGYDLALP
ncbi:MAG: iron-containing redox enzyme family protein [Alphaproteobacteria bacterium]